MAIKDGIRDRDYDSFVQTASDTTARRVQVSNLDSSTNATPVSSVNPEWSHYAKETVTLTNVANASPEFIYVDMAGYSGISIHVEKTGGTDTFDADFEASNEGSASTDDWLDVTTSWTFAAGSAAADFIAHPTNNDAFRPAAYRLEITTAGASDDADFNVFIYKW